MIVFSPRWVQVMAMEDIADFKVLDNQMYRAICLMRRNQEIFEDRVYEPAIVFKEPMQRRVLLESFDEMRLAITDNQCPEEREEHYYQFMRDFQFEFASTVDQMTFHRKLDDEGITDIATSRI